MINEKSRWIPFQTECYNKGIFKDIKVFHIYLQILTSVTHNDYTFESKKYGTIELKAGEGLFTIRQLANNCYCKIRGIKTLYRIIDLLTENGYIEVQSNPNYTIIKALQYSIKSIEKVEHKREHKREHLSNNNTNSLQSKVEHKREHKREQEQKDYITEKNGNNIIPNIRSKNEFFENEIDEEIMDNLNEKIIFELPTNMFNTKNETYRLRETIYNEFVSCYPNADIMSELKKMRAWLISNDTRRKTKQGMPKFINSWLSKAQDATKNFQNANYLKSNTQNNTSETEEDSFDRAWNKFNYIQGRKAE